MAATRVAIRPYHSQGEAQWVRCRVLALLDSAYFDEVKQRKPHYSNPAIELVAEHSGVTIVGLFDVECEETPGTVCSRRPVKVFAHFAGEARFDQVRSRFRRVHDCNLFELNLETYIRR